MSLDTTQTNALVLKSTPYGDADLILNILTDSMGKISCIAKHARRGKKGASIPEPLDFGRLEFKVGKGSLYLIRSFSVVQGHSQLRNDLSKMSAGLLLCEASDYLIPDEAGESEEILQSLLDVLRGIEAENDKKGILKLCFFGLSALLDLTGYLDPNAIGKPSSHSLLKLMKQVEDTAHRKLNTRSSVEMIISDLKAA